MRSYCLGIGVALFVSLASVRPGLTEEAEHAGVAHVRLAGDIDEAPVADTSIFGAAENFQSKLDRIKKARKDDSVKALLLQFDGLSVGWGKVDELRRAIADFRKSGKKVFAYMEEGAAKDYLVALACDRIVLPEGGWLMLVGMRSEISFFADTFSLIGVKADMLQMGEFKGAAEPFTRSKMSKEFRAQLTVVLDDFYDKSYVDPIAKGRASNHYSSDQVKKLIDEGPYTARAAQAAGLIDQVGYPRDVEEAIKKALDVPEIKVVRNYGQAKNDEIDLSNPFDLLKLLAPAKSGSSKKPKIAVIYAVGEIVSGKGGESMMGGSLVGSTSMVEAIRKAEDDKTVKAIVLRVDSPGGSALASDLIWNELVRCKKPVVASMGDVAASGGYYISMACRKIVAEPGTLTGSIGVVGGKFVTRGLFEKVGINTEVIEHGANSGILSSDAEFTDSQRKVMTGLMKDVYEQFLAKTLEGRARAGRKLTRTELDKLAAGRVWTGRQAKENGLVDELGTLADAIALAKEMAGAKDEELEILTLPRPRSFLDALLERKSDARAPEMKAAIAPLLASIPELKERIRGVDGLLRLRSEPVWLILPFEVRSR